MTKPDLRQILGEIEPDQPAPETAEPEAQRTNPATRRAVLPGWLRNLFRLPWHHLLYSFASAWMALMATGLMVQIAPVAQTTTLLLFGIAMVIFAIASLGYLANFLPRFGIKRIFVAVLSLLALTSMFFTIRQPADERLSTRLASGFGQALMAPIFWSNQVVRLAYKSGQDFGQRYFPETRQWVTSEEVQQEPTIDQVMQTLVASTGQATATQPPPAFVEGDVPAEIYAGGRVRVDTGGLRLRSRDLPGLSGTVIAMFEPGDILQVLDGPVEADGYTWWRVQAGDQAGWSAADFMTPVQ
ncbi:MAG TPA: hypothetical protein VLH85_05650 [Levilinea sp.]|nr:hypothetical protein [Levilinea sp.]